jgi:hypothetical protein
MKTILYLNLRRKFFTQIASGTKRIEYRDYTPYWRTRFEGRRYDVIQFRNGYATKAPEMLVEYCGYRIQGKGRKRQFAIRLGRILKIKRRSLKLATAIQKANAGKPLKSLRVQGRFNRSDWEALLKQHQIEAPNKVSQKDYAAFLRKQIETLFPDDAVRLQLKPLNQKRFRNDLQKLKPLFARNEKLFRGISFEAFMKKCLKAETAAELEALLPSILDRAFKGEL